MIEMAIRYGLTGFIVSAAFVGAWLLTLMVLALLARIIGGKPEDDDE